MTKNNTIDTAQTSQTDQADRTNTLCYCSFCGKNEQSVKGLIAGHSVYICDECVEVGSSIFREKHNINSRITLTSEPNHENYKKNIFNGKRDLSSPEEIFNTLSDNVIGQNQAKRILSVATYNHYQRLKHLENNNKHDKVKIDKSNIMLVGPTGCGKTLIVQTIAETLKVPFVSIDITSFTETGYKGEDVVDIISRLLAAAGKDIERAQRGIIYIDEIDKITSTDSYSVDITGKGVQQALLKIIEGTIVSIETKKNDTYFDAFQVDTSNILFICGGSFQGIEKIIEKRINKGSKNSIGFGVNIDSEKSDSNAHMEVTNEDLIKFGMIPEFIGRFPIVSALEALDKTALINILTIPKNALIKQYQQLFAMDNIELEFEQSAIEAIIKKALVLKTGARGLRSIVEGILLDFMFRIKDFRNKKLTITEEIVNGGCNVIQHSDLNQIEKTLIAKDKTSKEDKRKPVLSKNLTVTVQ